MGIAPPRNHKFCSRPNQPVKLRSARTYSDRASFVFLLLNFIIRNTSMYDVMQNSAVIPV
jgi:hypothetical protein